MAEEFKPKNPQGSTPEGRSGFPEGFNPKEFKELLNLASHERKNLQLLVEYFEKKSGELDERKRFFDR
ncbi:MAG: hypothetical protein HOJ13_00250, partial [Nitrospina sp.]|nr:hypothetical protein [Nitrospina sp.]